MVTTIGFLGNLAAAVVFVAAYGGSGGSIVSVGPEAD